MLVFALLSRPCRCVFSLLFLHVTHASHTWKSAHLFNSQIIFVHDCGYHHPSSHMSEGEVARSYFSKARVCTGRCLFLLALTQHSRIIHVPHMKISSSLKFSANFCLQIADIITRQHMRELGGGVLLVFAL